MPKHKRRPLTPEELELDAYFAHMKLTFPGVLAYHVPNEGKRARHVAKRIGIVSGIYDIYVDEPRGGFFGLRIEMKRGDRKSKVQDSQKSMGALYLARGYMPFIAWGWESAIEITKQYLNNPITEHKQLTDTFVFA